MSADNSSPKNSSSPKTPSLPSRDGDDAVPLVIFENLERATPTRIGKKKYEFFMDDPNDKSTNNDINIFHENHQQLISHQDNIGGLAFVGSFGHLDCSIGTIFQDDFRKTLEQLKSEEDKNHALSVLIVDDSVIQRKLSQKVLGGMIDEVMWMVECAENGERAMQLVQTSPRRPDVIIIDQNMEPGGGLMLGHQVVALLRKDKAFDNVVIIGCTGMAEEARQDLLLAGCDAVWSKPMPSREQAQAQIVQILRNKKSGSFNNSESFEFDLNSYPGFRNQPTYERNGGDQSIFGGSGPLQDEQKSSDVDIPVFRQVKMARISYKPVPSTASLLPFSRFSGGPKFNFGVLPPPPNSLTTAPPTAYPFGDEDGESDKSPLDITSMKRALANLSEISSCTSSSTSSPSSAVGVAAAVAANE
jgi:CheY-like chemotaxis protein